MRRGRTTSSASRSTVRASSGRSIRRAQGAWASGDHSQKALKGRTRNPMERIRGAFHAFACREPCQKGSHTAEGKPQGTPPVPNRVRPGGRAFHTGSRVGQSGFPGSVGARVPEAVCALQVHGWALGGVMCTGPTWAREISQAVVESLRGEAPERPRPSKQASRGVAFTTKADSRRNVTPVTGAGRCASRRRCDGSRGSPHGSPGGARPRSGVRRSQRARP